MTITLFNAFLIRTAGAFNTSTGSRPLGALNAGLSFFFGSTAVAGLAIGRGATGNTRPFIMFTRRTDIVVIALADIGAAFFAAIAAI